jgi:hypothetical protein
MVLVQLRTQVLLQSFRGLAPLLFPELRVVDQRDVVEVVDRLDRLEVVVASS